MSKKIVIGILAHVDAGKTTLSEALLYSAGALRTLGRVDHGDAFLDTDALERERGITIFSKQALFSVNGIDFTLIDTPGHVDFSAEAERVLQVLDAAILVISGTDGLQSHTRTLWRLLERYGVPTFLFVNKTDLPTTDCARVMSQLSALGGCVDFSSAARDENIAMCSEEALDQFLSDGKVADGTVSALIRGRRLFPVCFGSALKMDGVREFADILARYAPVPADSGTFGARVFKISRDAQGTRLTWLRITGGALRAKSVLSCSPGTETDGEKADQLRLYSGAKFRTVDSADAGMVVAVTGLNHTRPGQALGACPDAPEPILAPVLTYRLLLPDGIDPYLLLPKLRQLEDEDPALHIVWNESLHEIHVQLMGQVQLEILQKRIAERFALDVSFGEGRIVYRETIAKSVIGMGHFEPLRHYAEVQLLLEPLPRGSGIEVASVLSSDRLDLNWQRLIFTHILECAHPGVLTGSPLTDVRFTLVAGRAHAKHTEGGDFRQATYRAIRQGLMQAESILLEPYYDFRLELPQDCVGRAMSDLQAMGGTIDAPMSEEGAAVLTGCAPVAPLRGYAQTLAAYTRGQGQLSCSVRGYDICHDADAVIASSGYDPEHDTEHPSWSVFCEHGGSVLVPWDEVAPRMHTESVLRLDVPEAEDSPLPRAAHTAADEGELLAIFERTYGKIERKAFEPPKTPARTSLDDRKYSVELRTDETEYLLVDGYNVIFAWDELKRLAAQDIAYARGALTDILSNYQGWRKCVVILVFDAYKVKGNPGSMETVNGVRVVYTKEAQTADAYIERATYELRRERRVRVATSDNLEQVIILGHGAQRISAAAFHAEVVEAEGQIDALIERYNARSGRSTRLGDIATFRS